MKKEGMSDSQRIEKILDDIKQQFQESYDIACLEEELYYKYNISSGCSLSAFVMILEEYLERAQK